MDDIPKASGPVFPEEHVVNLYYLHELYGEIARHVAEKIKTALGIDLPISAGVWGGTYYIAHPDGRAKRRIWRFYSIVNLPQNSPLDIKANLEHLIGLYYKAFADAFQPFGLRLDLKMWGGRLPFSNKAKPSITLHMEDANQKVRWLRAFFVWNTASWEQSIIHDLVRNIKVLKQDLNLERKPAQKKPDETKYLMQDIIITYYTIRNACSDDFLEHADPIIEDTVKQFMEGLHDPDQIQDLYLKMYHNALIYGFEEALDGPFGKANLDIRNIEQWPVDKINWIPEELKERLIPPIQEIFSGFKTILHGKNKSDS